MSRAKRQKERRDRTKQFRVAAKPVKRTARTAGQQHRTAGHPGQRRSERDDLDRFPDAERENRFDLSVLGVFHGSRAIDD